MGMMTRALLPDDGKKVYESTNIHRQLKGKADVSTIPQLVLLSHRYLRRKVVSC